ncbi:hypothetical protein IIU_06509 [Bacillus cereus VD133]|uniref:Uncharacterized protein n=1 Tax=Bacillus cereus VD133 TaxID=1053233 RepID=A0A9W5UZG9_BACCE|nr:hypothetical protein IIU_06509 [Bacillus cereus VD133]
MPFQISMQGHWKLTVITKDAWFKQQIVISGSKSDGIYPGIVGMSVEIKGQELNPWTLKIQHNNGTIWGDSELRLTPEVLSGSQITFNIESEDEPASGSDNDFNDLIVKAEKVGMIEVPFRPYALRMNTLQMMPDGVFEAALGTYYMGVCIQNVWTKPLSADSLIGISDVSRNILAAGGVQIIDTWSTEEQEVLGQKMQGAYVVLGSLAPGEMRTIYFKVNCKSAKPRKHIIEFKVINTAMPDPNHLNRRTTQTIFVTRSSFNAVTKEFVSECDRGRLFLKLREVTVEYSSLINVVRCAREHRAQHGDPIENRARDILQNLLSGQKVDLCELKHLLDCFCTNDDRNSGRWPCGDILMFPTVFDYRVVYNKPYVGQYGPIPFDDPWWKVVLMILAILLTAAAGASEASDIANGSDDVVIGKLFSSSLEPEADGKYLVDAALCALNGNRALPSVMPPIQILDAQSGENYLVPIDALDGEITLTGETMSNLEIANRIAAYTANKNDPSAIEGVRVFKSGARTGLTHGLMVAVEDLHRTDDDGVTRHFKEQIRFIPIKDPTDPASGQRISQTGDSGSLWIHKETKKIVALNHSAAIDDSGSIAHGTRIEDVINKMNIRFL